MSAQPASSWPVGNSQIATLVRALDASGHPLGAPAQWPPTLRAAIDFMLPSQVQIALLWGPEFITFYNDAHIAALGEQHPGAFGRPANEAGAGHWDELRPLFERVLHHGEALVARDRPHQVVRDGHSETAYFDVSCSPVRDEQGSIGGVLCVMNETTGRVRAEKALAASEKRLRETVEYTARALDAGAVVGTWLWDIEQGQFSADEGLSRLFLTDPTALKQGVPVDRVLDAMHPDDRARFTAYVDRAWKVDATYCVEHRLRTATGPWRWFLGRGQFERNHAGRALRCRGVMIDIDQRKRSELAQHEISEQWRLAKAAGGIGTFLLDIATDVVTGSPTFCRMFGQPEQQCFPASQIDCLRTDTDSAMSTAQGRADGSAALDVEYRIRRANDGALRWIARRAELVRNADGMPVLVRGVVQDVTERKRVEARLRTSEARFRTLAQSLPLHVWTAAPDGAFDWVNQPFCDYTGLAPEQLLGDGWSVTIHPQDLPRVVATWQHALATQTPCVLDLRQRDREGAYRWQLVRAQPIENGPADGPVRWIGTCTDIELQKATLTRLTQRAEDQTRDRDRLWELSGDLMIVADQGPNGRIKAINPAWKKVLGWSEAEVLESGRFALVHPDDLALTYAGVKQLAQGVSPVRLEHRLRHKDGSYRVIAWTTVPDGPLLHGVGRDMTALREAELRSHQSQKMEAVGQLTGGIAHDFNNMLQGITGAIEVMRRRVALGHVEGVERYMDAATQAAQRAASLVQRLLTFSRRQPLDPKPVDVSVLLTSMEDLLRRTLGEQVDLEVSPDVGVGCALCDENQLESAILNLAINARDAMPGGGRLALSARRAALSAQDLYPNDDATPGDYVALRVTDTGSGMSPEVLAKVFDPFFTTKAIGHGTGLGLSMVHDFAQQSHGHVVIHSQPGQGTTITLYLPPADARAARLPGDFAKAAAAPQGHGEVVLVVEDDAEVRHLVLEVLADLGYRTLEAVDGTAAALILRSSIHVDVLVSDVGLPGLNGRQVAQIARQRWPALPILFLTGYASGDAMHPEFQAPGMQLMTKPFAIDDLARRIGQLALRKRA